MWGLGKRRTALGKWLDSTSYSQEDLAKASGVNRDTVSKSCNDIDYIPSAIVMRKIMTVVKKIDPGKRGSHFWDV